jgi:hypothetical protein
MAEAELSLVADSKVSFGGVFSGDPTAVADFTTDMTYVAVAGVTDIGDFGDEAEIATLKTIDGGRVRKKVGSKDAGTFELTVGRDPADAGQIAMRAAVGSKDAYALKIELNDAPAGVGSTPTTFYLKAYVASAKNKQGGADDFVTTVFTFAIDAAPLEVPAAAA